ncbi:ATPase [Thermocladium modestius]|uniref:ATPase n=1 Tax=Thermocladium modestius TaxID=62609 RepID=A0A830GW57_9CREN|nr:ATP-binding protein [Thermocladium modestius]GGP21148.1 ATPase [Thermocladium modestius]
MGDEIGYVVGNIGSSGVKVAIRTDMADKVQLFEYVSYRYLNNEVLGYVVNISREPYKIGEDLAADALSSAVGVQLIETIIATVMLLGYKDSGLKLPRSPPPVGTPVKLADPQLIKEYLGLRGRLCVGYLASQDVQACLDEKGLARHMAIIAATGSGKTWLSVLLIEELLKLGATVVVLDPHGEYITIKDSAKKLGNVGVTVIKAAKHHVGDKRYSMNVLRVEPDQLASIAGVPSGASRIRHIIYLIHSLMKIIYKTVNGAGESGSVVGMIRLINSLLVRPLGASDIQRALRIQQPIGEDNVLEPDKFKQLLNELRSAAGDARQRSAIISARVYLKRLARTGVYRGRTTPLSDVLRPRHVSVINLAGVSDEVQDHIAYHVLSRILKARINYVRQLGNPQYPYPVVVIVEEAHRFAPPNKSTLSHSLINRIAAEGRKFGVYLVVITQRPSKIDQDVLSQCQNHAILKVVNPLDREAIIASSEALSDELVRIIGGLNKGEALIVGPMAPAPLLIKLRERRLDYGGGDIDLDKYWGVSDGESITKVRDAWRKAMIRAVPPPDMVATAMGLVVDGLNQRGHVVSGYVDGSSIEINLRERTWSCSKCGNALTPCEHVVALFSKVVFEKASLLGIA